MDKIILGSGSPRRKMVLDSMGIPIEVLKPLCPEVFSEEVLPSRESQRLAEQKMKYLLEKESKKIQQRWVLCADTVVYTERHKMGKADSRESAREMLMELSGRTHWVSTSLYMKSPDGNEQLETCVSEVLFKTLNNTRIEFYLDNEHWQDAAGAYKIQSLGDLLIERINGSFSNVMGLPIALFYDMISSMSYF